MFGYIVPVNSHLSEEDKATFSAAYCGLCRCLTYQYGKAFSWFLNYDFVFLTLLLSTEHEFRFEKKRCPYRCLRCKKCLAPDSGMDRAAALSVILTYWKMQDGIHDEGFPKRLVYYVLSLSLRRGYQRAAKRYPLFDNKVREELTFLQELEKEHCGSMDRMADCFAKILQNAAMYEPENTREALSQLLYHIGRWIYLVDARDDLAEDIRKGRFNPLQYRFSEEERRTGLMDERLSATMLHSRNMAGAAFDSLIEGKGSGIIQNILYFGLPTTSKAVFQGKWRNRVRKNAFKLEKHT